MKLFNYLKVVPNDAYLNSTFCILTDKKGKFDFYKDNKIVSSVINTHSNTTSIYFNPKQAGMYSIKYVDSLGNVETFKDCFSVRDSYIFGSSKYKSSYLFDTIPYVFIVKKDRTLVYDIDNDKLFDLFDFSPDFLYKYSNNELLSVVYDNQSIKLSILDLETFGTRTIKDSADLILESNMFILYKVGSTIELFAKWYENKGKEFCIEDVQDFKLFDKRFLLVEKNKEFLLYDFLSIGLKNYISINKENHFAINFTEGYILYMLGDTSFKLVSFISKYEYIFQVSDLYFFDASEFEYDYNFVFKSLKIKPFEYRKFYKEKALQTLSKNRNLVMGEWFDVELDKNNLKHEVNHIDIIFQHRECHILEKQSVSTVTKVRGRKTKQDRFLKTIDELWDIDYTVDNSLTIKVLHECSYIIEDWEVLFFSLNTIIWYSDKNQEIIIELNGKDYFINSVKDPQFYSNSRILSYKASNGGYCVSQLLEDTIIHYSESDKAFEFKYIDTYNKILGVSQGNVYSYFINLNSHKVEHIIYPNLFDDYRADKEGIFYESSSILENSFIQNSDGLILSIKSGLILSSIPSDELVIQSSFDSKLILTRNQHDSYQVYVFSPETSVYKYISFDDEQIAYDSKNSKLLPEGNKLLLKRDRGGILQLYNFDTMEYEDFYDGNFVEFSDEGNVVIEDKRTNKYILDPNTFQPISSNTHHFYRFKSLDRRLSTPLSKCTEYYIIQSNIIISAEEYNSFKHEFGRKWNEKSEEYYQRISDFLNEVKDDLQLTDLHKIKNFEDFATYEYYIEVKDHKTGDVLELPVKHLNYYNYAAFSPDNRFLTYVGKPILGDGGFGVIELEYVNLRYRFKSHHWYSKAEYATWVCGVSNQSYFATYNSKVKTFVLNLNEDFINDSNEFINSHVKELSNRSYLNFNYKGNLMALSQSGYNPITLGGSGHKKSSMLFLYDLVNDFERCAFAEHSANVTSAAFSKDDRKLFSIDEDGVIIVRNIDLEY